MEVIETTKKHGECLWPAAEEEIVREIIDYSEMKSNKSMIIERTIVEMIAEAEDWPTSIALPLSESEEININWKKWMFTPKRLDPVPEEGVSETLQSRMKSRSDALVRYGISFQQELGFQATPEGSKELMGYLKSMSASIRETLGYDVITTYLNTPNYKLEWQKQYGIIPRYHSVKQMMEEDVLGYGIFAKYERGFEDILDKTICTMRDWTAIPDLIVTAKGSKHSLAFRKCQNDFGKSGQPAVDTVQLGSRYFKTFQSCVMVESRSFHVENEKQPEDPMVHEKQVGEYYVMKDFYGNDSSSRDYHSRQCDIGIYDEERDDFVRITLKDALNACGRFDDKEQEILQRLCDFLNEEEDDLDNEMLEEELRRLKNNPDFIVDPFIYRDCRDEKYKIAKTFKQIRGTTIPEKVKELIRNQDSDLKKEVIEKMIDNDIPLPFQFLLFRPHITHKMGSMIVAVRGTNTGGTFIHKKDFRAGYDHQTKTMSAHFTFWAKPIVLVEENVQVVKDVTFHGYVNGGNTKFINTQKNNNNNSSLFSILTTYNDEIENPLDLSGIWNRNYIRNVTEPVNQSSFHYTSASYYSLLWGWKQAFQTKPYGEEDYFESIYNDNNICFQGFQWIYRPLGGSGDKSFGDYKRCIKGTGHLGDPYRGIKAVRMGYKSQMEDQKYEDVLTI